MNKDQKNKWQATTANFIRTKVQITEFITLIACPSGPTIQTVSVKKPKHLELSNSIWILQGL